MSDRRENPWPQPWRTRSVTGPDGWRWGGSVSGHYFVGGRPRCGSWWNDAAYVRQRIADRDREDPFDLRRHAASACGSCLTLVTGP